MSESVVRAKFRCEEKSETGIQPCHVTSKLVLRPVVNGSDENEWFYAATPGGQIDLQVVNPAAAKQFEVGKTYYIDFTPAE
jgi:hypothetical protein